MAVNNKVNSNNLRKNKENLFTGIYIYTYKYNIIYNISLIIYNCVAITPYKDIRLDFYYF